MARIIRVFPVQPADLRGPPRDRHQRRHVAPQIERAEVPARSPHPFLRPAHVLHDQRDFTPSRLASLPLDTKARLEKRIVGRRQRLGALPRHGAIAVGLAGRGGDDQRGVLELRAVERAHVLDDELAGIAVLAVLVPLDVEADDAIAFGEPGLGPAAESAIEINGGRLVCSGRRPLITSRTPERNLSHHTSTPPGNPIESHPYHAVGPVR